MKTNQENFKPTFQTEEMKPNPQEYFENKKKATESFNSLPLMQKIELTAQGQADQGYLKRKERYDWSCEPNLLETLVTGATNGCENGIYYSIWQSIKGY